MLQRGKGKEWGSGRQCRGIPVFHAKLILSKEINKPAPAVLMFHGYTDSSRWWNDKLQYAAAGKETRKEIKKEKGPRKVYACLGDSITSEQVTGIGTRVCCRG